jgi:hypothetical protein
MKASMFRIAVLFLLVPSSILLQAQAPGGYSTGLSFWLKADGSVFQDINGSTPAGIGNNVLSWRDQAGNALLQNSAGETPPVLRNSSGTAINFNPVVDFQNSHLFAPNSPGMWTLFIVAEPFANNSLAPLISMPCSGNTCATRQVRVETANNWYCCDFDDFGNTVQTLGFGANGFTGFTTAHLFTLTAGDLYVFSNGVQMGDTVTYAAPNSNRRFWGRVAEVVAYNDILGAGERERVQSYLALKYGLALDQNYLASNSTTLWNTASNAGYNSRITGIGRDDASGLLQKQSTSTIDDNLTLALGSIAATNQANTANPANNKFLLWGHNDLALNDKVLLPAAIGALSHRSAKIYKFANIGGLTDNIQMRFDYPLLDCADPAQAKLLISDDENFSNPTVVNLQSFTANSLTFSTNAIANGKYVAIGYALNPGAPTVSGTLAICDNGNSGAKLSSTGTTLTASGNLNGASDWYWYAGDCGSMLIAVGPTVNITQTGFYSVRGENPSCGIAGPCTTVQVLGYSPDASASYNDPVCEGGTLQLFGASTSTITSWSWSGPNGWSSNQQNPVIPNVNASFSGDYQLVITDNTGCQKTTSLSVLIGTADVADAGPDQLLCDTYNTVVTGNTPLNGAGLWTIVSGSATIIPPTGPSAEVLNLPLGTTVLRWTITPNNGCPVSTDQVSITVRNPNPTLSSNSPVCSGNALIINVNGVQLSSYVWEGPNAYFSTAAQVNINPALPLNAGDYTVTVTDIGGCTAAASIFVNVLNVTTAFAGADQQLCNAGSTQMAANDVSGTWSVVSGTATLVSPNEPNTQVTNLVPGGTVVLEWTTANGPCTNTDQVSIFNDLEISANAGNDQNLCNVSSATLQGNAAAPGSGLWTKISGPGTVLSPNNPGSQVSGLVPGQSSVFRWTITGPLGICTTFDEVTINSNLPPAAANAGPDQLLCDVYNTVVTGNTPQNGSGLWTVVSGSATIIPPTGPSAEVLDLQVGTTVLRWTITPANGCPATQDQMSIVVRDPNASITSSDPVCAGSALTLLADGNALVAYQWSGPNGFSSTQSTVTIDPVSAANAGDYFLTVTDAGGCTAVVVENVDILPLPIAEAGPDQQLCEQNSTNVSANDVLGVWTVVSGTANIVNPTEPNTEVNGLTPGSTVVLRWTASNNGFCFASDELTLQNDLNANPANAGPDQQLCNATSTQLQGNNPAGGTGLWTKISGPGIVATPAAATSVLNGLIPGQSTRLEWRILGPGGICVSRDTVEIRSNPIPPAANAGPNQLVCNQFNTVVNANTPQSGSGEWTVVSGSATLAPANSPVAEVLDLQAGITVLRWTITPDNGCPATQDELSITVGNPDPFIVSSAPICSGQELNMIADGNNLVQYQWSGPNGFSANQDQVVINPATAINAGTYTVTVTDALGCSAAEEILVEIDPFPLADAGPDQELCEQSSTQMAANDASGEWILVSGAATIVSPFEPNTQVTGLQAGTTVRLRWVVSATGATLCAAQDEVLIINNISPGVASAGPDQQICGNSTQLDATVPASGSGAWTVVSGTAVFANANDPNTAVSGLSNGLNILRWTLAGGASCPGSSDHVNIVVNPVLTADAGPDQSLCYQNQSSLAAGAVLAGTSGQWTVVSGSASFADSTNPQSAVSGLANGPNLLRWTVSANNGICPAVADEVQITVLPAPGLANAGPDIQVCGTTATLQATQPAFGAGQWSVLSGVAVIDQLDNPASTLSGLENGEEVFLVWTVANQSCPANSDTVRVFAVHPLPQPDAGPDQTICYNPATQLAANTAPTNVNTFWSVISGSGQLENENNPLTQVSNLNNGLNIFQWNWSDGFGICPSASNQVIINVIPSPGLPNAGPDISICVGEKAPLQAQAPLNGAGLWSTTTGNVLVETPDAPNSLALLNGPDTLIWSVANGACPVLSDTAVLTPANAAPAADAGQDRSFCGAQEIAMQAVLPQGFTGQWTVLSGAGALLNPDNPNSYVENLSLGENTFRWSVQSPAGSCQSSSDDVILTLLELPSVADAGPDQAFCGDKTILQALVPGTGQGQWTIVSGNGVLDDNTAANALLSGLSAGATVVLNWSVSNGACPTVFSDEVIIENIDPATLPAADAGADQTLCYTNTTILQAATPPNGLGAWSFISGAGVFDNLNDPASGINGLVPGINEIQWSVDPGLGCPPSIDMLTLTVVTAPDQPLAGADQTLCAGASAQLSANNPATGQGVWQILSGPGSLSDPNQPGSLLSGLVPGQNTVLQWSTSNGTCPGWASDALTISNDLAPSAAQAGADISACISSTLLNATPPVTGTGNWSILNGGGVLADATAANSNYNNIPLGVNTLVWTVSNGVCPPNTDAVQITNVGQLSADAGPDQTLCNATQLNLNASAPTNGSGVWSVFTGTGQVSAPANPQSLLSNLAPGSSVTLQWTVSLPGCTDAVDQVTIQSDALPSAAVAGDDQVLCGDNSFILQGTAPLSGSGQWDFLNGNGFISNTNEPNATLSNLIFDTPVTLIWTVSSGVCPSVRDTVEIFPKTLPSEALAGPDQQLCNAAQVVLAASNPQVGSGLWEIVQGTAQITDNQSSTTTLNGLLANSDTLVVRWSVSVPGCHENADTLLIINDALPSAAQAGADALICFDEVTLNATPPVVGSGVWTLSSGTAVIQDPGAAQTTLSNLPQGSTATLVWTVSNGVCPASSDALTVSYYNDDILYADFLINAVACVDDSFHIVEISDSALVADSYFWDFGDGTTSLERDPVHTYSSAGDFNVTLTATLGPCSTTMQKTVIVANCFQTGFKGNRAFAYGQVSPNPTDGPFRLFLQMNKTDQEVETLLLNSTGALLQQRSLPAQENMYVPFEQQTPGVYYLKVRCGRDQMVFKIVCL